MIQHSDHFHGSDLEKIEKIYGIPREKIVSFSANVNPLGLSGRLKTELAEHLDVITGYPDREYISLRRAIADYCHSEPEHVIVGNGSTELISLFIQIAHPGKALIVGPTYSEYEREVSLGGGTSLYFPLKEKDDFALDYDKLIGQLNESIDLLIMCNPNNPTSTCISRQTMRSILDVCKVNDIFVMVDETYIEFTEDYDNVNCVPLTQYYNNIIILRGISKFFAAPGLRLGYALTGNADLIKAINLRKNPWTINSLAEEAGRIMFSDTDYIDRTKELIAKERSRVTGILSEMGTVRVYRPSANFVLSRILKDDLNADILFDACIREGMMIRNCCTFPFLDNKYFRICFMSPEMNDKLLAVIQKTLG
ncbi:MAG: aminotransferase class I/II-fold pyridoxal phosphate-dependent enzyme [Lachnospiraceae bacterium]|nr:aminotransferase class I/II-fold pyridoxal phosphate-dependent enzyme [Lachnospiraceae bacterium]MBR5765150.1 aminotransferase class I/II-fold pyridoxal phosphate-dependent enzyme [Lachnospiraceae bacterium]